MAFVLQILQSSAVFVSSFRSLPLMMPSFSLLSSWFVALMDGCPRPRFIRVLSVSIHGIGYAVGCPSIDEEVILE